MDTPNNEELHLELYEMHAYLKTVLRFIVFIVVVATSALVTRHDFVMNYIMSMPGPIVLLVIPAVIAVSMMMLFWVVKPLDDHQNFLNDLSDDLDIFS